MNLSYSCEVLDFIVRIHNKEDIVNGRSISVQFEVDKDGYLLNEKSVKVYSPLSQGISNTEVQSKVI